VVFVDDVCDFCCKHPNYLWPVLLIVVVNILLVCSKDISGMKADFYCKHPNKIMLVFVINYCCKYVSDLL
jgi:hypothetical protein